jgi:hypothetical protein
METELRHSLYILEGRKRQTDPTGLFLTGTSTRAKATAIARTLPLPLIANQLATIPPRRDKPLPFRPDSPILFETHPNSTAPFHPVEARMKSGTRLRAFRQVKPLRISASDFSSPFLLGCRNDFAWRREDEAREHGGTECPLVWLEQILARNRPADVLGDKARNWGQKPELSHSGQGIREVGKGKFTHLSVRLAG